MFEYSAVDAESEETTGKIEATTQVDAINKLKNQGLWPKQVIEESKGKLKASKNDRKKIVVDLNLRVSRKDLIFYRQYLWAVEL